MELAFRLVIFAEKIVVLGSRQERKRCSCRTKIVADMDTRFLGCVNKMMGDDVTIRHEPLQKIISESLGDRCKTYVVFGSYGIFPNGLTNMRLLPPVSRKRSVEYFLVRGNLSVNNRDDVFERVLAVMICRGWN